MIRSRLQVMLQHTLMNDDANIDWMPDITVSIMNESTVKLDIEYSLDI